MSLPAFLNRVADAAGPLMGGIGESELGDVLKKTALRLEIGTAAGDAGQRAGYLLAANLAARLYPTIELDAPESLKEEALRLVHSINADCELPELDSRGEGDRLTLSWLGGKPSARRVTVRAADWNLWLDTEKPADSAASAPAAMAAAAIGIGELFRAVFAANLSHGREAPAPFCLNLITLGEPTDVLAQSERVSIGDVHLAGCGAIGQAATATLRHLPVKGRLYAVDFDRVDHGNLQRYVLSGANDVGREKPAQIKRALKDTRVRVDTVAARWGGDPRTAPGRECVLCALDTKQGRIELAAGLHREVFNAWTQELDIGVSRHLEFGTRPCLACLAWPKGQRPSESALIAAALGEEELRIVIYLAGRIPIGMPLPAEAIGPTGRLPVPEGANAWSERSLLEDLIARYQLPHEPFEPLVGEEVTALYRDAACGSLLMAHAGTERGVELSVPLAHQSALAGVMLATWLFASKEPALRELLPDATQARFDVLRGGEQLWPRNRDPEPACICQDSDFESAYASRWG